VTVFVVAGPVISPGHEKAPIPNGDPPPYQ